MKLAVCILLITLTFALTKPKKQDQVKIVPGDDEDDPTEVYIAGPNSNEVATSSGAEVISMLVNKDEATIPYVVLFHSGNSDGPSKKQVRDMENGIRENILAGHQEVRFIKVDGSKKNYEDVI